MKNYVVKLKPVPEPRKDCSLIPVALTDETLEERRQKILSRMRSTAETLNIWWATTLGLKRDCW